MTGISLDHTLPKLLICSIEEILIKTAALIESGTSNKS